MVLLWWTLSCRQSYRASDVISREQAGPAPADQLSPWLPTTFVRLICQQKTLASVSNQSGAQSEDLTPGKPSHLLSCSPVSSSLTGVVLSSRIVGRPQAVRTGTDLYQAVGNVYSMPRAKPSFTSFNHLALSTEEKCNISLLGVRVTVLGHGSGAKQAYCSSGTWSHQAGFPVPQV